MASSLLRSAFGAGLRSVVARQGKWAVGAELANRSQTLPSRFHYTNTSSSSISAEQARFLSSGASSSPKAARRYGMMIKVRPEFEEEYIRYHAAVWPGVLQTIRDCNISNYSIFLRDGMLFGYFEYRGQDLKVDMAKMGQCPETQKWWEVMKPMQQPMENLKADEDWWAMLEEVFHTD